MGCGCGNRRTASTLAAAAARGSAGVMAAAPSPSPTGGLQWQVRCPDGGTQTFLNESDALREASVLGCATVAVVSHPMSGVVG